MGMKCLYRKTEKAGMGISDTVIRLGAQKCGNNAMQEKRKNKHVGIRGLEIPCRRNRWRQVTK
jgi:hypothetical protein